jgi:hypothetical protein
MGARAAAGADPWEIPIGLWEHLWESHIGGGEEFRGPRESVDIEAGARVAAAEGGSSGYEL